MSDKYILDADGVTPIPCNDLMEWARWYETGAKLHRQVAVDEIGDAKVSTVFLALDHSFGSGEPVLWETMVFGGPHDGEQWRYCSHAAAVAGHANALALVRGDESAVLS